jgi:arabinosaccharide transport system substrate-binding protein
MIGITKKCRQPDLAWELAKHLYLDPQERAETFVETNILPPVKDPWSRPEFSARDDYWSDQQIGQMYIELAEEVPPQYTSPFILTAKGKMNEALTACTSYYNANQNEGFEAFVRATLKESADEVRVYMSRNPF